MSRGDKERDKAWGRMAEDLAVRHLIAGGYVVRERNWSPPHSHLEVDIIAETGGKMVFVEVKARRDDAGDPVAAVDLAKQRRITRAADIYLRSLEFDYDYRFDIIAVTGNPDGHTLEHLPDAFLAPLGTC